MIIMICNGCTGGDVTQQPRESTAHIQKLLTSSASPEATPDDHPEGAPTISSTPKSIGYTIMQETFTGKNIEINYPQISGLKETTKQKTINTMLKSEALKNSIEESPDLKVLQRKYDVKLMSTNVLSVQYLEYVNYKGAPYPSELYFTSNMNMNTGSTIELSDLISINESFVKKLKDGKFKALKSFQAVALDGLSEKDIMHDLKNAAFYLTSDSLGISIDVPHALGDHAEFEVKYTDIMDNMNHENGVWGNFPNLASSK